MKVLVTGHLGFVGGHLCRALSKRCDEVIGIDLEEGRDILSCKLPPVDRVYHLAAQTDAQFQSMALDAQINITGTLRLLTTYGPKLVLASSSMVNYPVVPYAISKRAAEDYALLCGAAVVRFCNLYGKGGHSVIDVFKASKRLTVRGTGEQVRTYASVNAAVEALLGAAAGTLTVLPGRDYTINQIVKEMFPNKPVDRVPAEKLDILDGRQLFARAR